MIREERLLKVLRAPHVSEKASTAMEKTNTIVLKVAKDATKAEIKAAVQKLFEVEVEVVNTLVVKGKVKRHGQRIGRRSDWKKAYVTLKEGQNLTNRLIVLLTSNATKTVSRQLLNVLSTIRTVPRTSRWFCTKTANAVTSWPRKA